MSIERISVGERRYRMLEYLKKINEYRTAEQISKHFNISRYTAIEDIEVLIV